MKTATVVIEASGHGYSSRARIFIDGQRLPNICSVKTSLTVDGPPIVTLDLSLSQNIKIENASIVVGNVVMPESVEQALWKYLVAKYAPAINVTKLGSKRLRVIDITTLGSRGCASTSLNRRRGKRSSSRRGDEDMGRAEELLTHLGNGRCRCCSGSGDARDRDARRAQQEAFFIAAIGGSGFWKTCFERGVQTRK